MLENTVTCRETQLNELRNLLGEYGDPLPPALFLNGNKSTGKKLCIKKTMAQLETSGYRHVQINCRESHSPKPIYETILSGFNGNKIKCGSLVEFVNELKKLSKLRYEPFVIIIDKPEILYTMNKTVMLALCRLREFCDLNICTIFISHLSFAEFFFDMGSPQMITIHFPNYDMKEMYDILLESRHNFVEYICENQNFTKDDVKDIQDEKFFSNFLNAFLSVFFRNCRDLMELKQRALYNFSLYCQPVLENKIASTDIAKLWRHITPSLKKSLKLSCLYSDPPVYDTENINHRRNDESHENLPQFVELPVCAKYLLIAAYLASYNPASKDKRLFMKNHGKQKNTLKQVKAKSKLTEKMSTKMAPKVFTLNRLLAIFYSISEKMYTLNDAMMSEVASLVTWDLISSSDEVDLDIPKYKCAVGFNYVSAIAKSVGFELKKYLCDFI